MRSRPIAEVGTRDFWMLAVASYHALGEVAGSILLILATCWFTSLQHELIHGHPCRNRKVTWLMGIDDAPTIEAFRGRGAAINPRDSHSGCDALTCPR